MMPTASAIDYVAETALASDLGARKAEGEFLPDISHQPSKSPSICFPMKVC